MDVSAVCHVDHGHRPASVVDAVDHAVGAAGAVPVVQGRAELLADAVGVVEQWADDELVGGCGDGFRQVLGELPARGGGDGQDVARPEARSTAWCVGAAWPRRGPPASRTHRARVRRPRRAVFAWRRRRRGSRWSLRGTRGLPSPGEQQQVVREEQPAVPVHVGRARHGRHGQLLRPATDRRRCSRNHQRFPIWNRALEKGIHRCSVAMTVAEGVAGRRRRRAVRGRRRADEPLEPAAPAPATRAVRRRHR